jgi:hypothetical protein
MNTAVKDKRIPAAVIVGQLHRNWGSEQNQRKKREKGAHC